MILRFYCYVHFDTDNAHSVIFTSTIKFKQAKTKLKLYIRNGTPSIEGKTGEVGKCELFTSVCLGFEKPMNVSIQGFNASYVYVFT